MTNIKLEKEDFIKALREQLYFIDISLISFSNGAKKVKLNNKVVGEPIKLNGISVEIEAKRIAAVIRTLVHDTKNSRSLLKHLEIKNKINFLNSAPQNDRRLHSMTGMRGVTGSPSDKYFGLVAKINNRGQLVSVPLFMQHLKEWYHSYSRLKFEEWGEKEVYSVNDLKFSRKEIVLTMANKDGGTHIASKQPENYREMKDNGLMLNIEGNRVKLEGDVAFATVAQIGWEILNSIDESDLVLEP